MKHPPSLTSRLVLVRLWQSMIFLLIASLTLALPSIADGAVDLPMTPKPDSPPLLTGRHFKITAIEEQGFVDVQENRDGSLSYSGYLIDILKELSHRANFTYELRPPSGYGSRCVPRLVDNATLPSYDSRYRQDYRCGESDVNDRPLSHYSTDLYWGMYYITPERIQVNQYSIPFSPPETARLGMLGTATHIRSIEDLRQHPNDYKVCALSGTAYLESLQLSFPDLNIRGIARDDSVHSVLEKGICHVIIDVYPMLKRNIFNLYRQGKCLANGKPIGVIGEPLQFGHNHMAFGIRMDLSPQIVQALNYWLQALMSCFPNDPNGYCPNGQGSLSQLYKDHGGGRGDDCGYVQFPRDDQLSESSMPAGVIAAIALTPVIVVIAMGMTYHNFQLKEQEKRMKKRFIQQLARNIDIGPSAKQISAAKLSETYDHIGGQDGLISKDDLSQWMNDLNLDFLSERDFDRLWDTMDLDHTGFVDPLEFYAFLSECEKQFEEVHHEYSALPKSEKMKLAARRLTNYHNLGKEEVERMERRHKRRNRQVIMPPCIVLLDHSTSSSHPRESHSDSTTTATATSKTVECSLLRNMKMSDQSRRVLFPSSRFESETNPTNTSAVSSQPPPRSDSMLQKIEEAFGDPSVGDAYSDDRSVGSPPVVDLEHKEAGEIEYATENSTESQGLPEEALGNDAEDALGSDSTALEDTA